MVRGRAWHPLEQCGQSGFAPAPRDGHAEQLHASSCPCSPSSSTDDNHRVEDARALRATVAPAARVFKAQLKALRRREARAHAKGERVQGSGEGRQVVVSTMLAHGSHLEVSKARKNPA